MGVRRVKRTDVRDDVAGTWGLGGRKVKVRAGWQAGTRVYRGLQFTASSLNLIRRATT